MKNEAQALVPVDRVVDVDESGFERLEAVDTLQPGYYWRVLTDLI